MICRGEGFSIKALGTAALEFNLCLPCMIEKLLRGGGH